MKLTAAQLAKRLGISRATIFNLKKSYPAGCPKSFDEVEAWRQFCLAHSISPEVICRLAR
jgi:hypothetical protein